MAKRRAHPKVNFDPSERLPQPTSPVKLDIEGAIARRRSRIAALGHTSQSPVAKSASGSNQAETQALKRPGELERVIELITEGFKQADLTHRAAIDQQVVECFRVASFLKQNRLGGDRLLGGEWVKFWGQNGRNGDAALRFVFKKVHSDAKKASFYYRATCKLFEEGVRFKDLPARISAAGGYQRLADKNVEMPRRKVATPRAEIERTKTRQVKAKGQHTSSGTSISATPQHENDGGDQSQLVTITASEGIAFFALPLPCSALLDVELSQGADGELLMRIVGLKQIE